MLLAFLLTACDAFVLEPCPGRAWSSVSAGYQHVCALDDEGDVTGEVSCSGAGASEEVLSVPEGPWAAVTGGYDYACALDEGGAATCWGDDRYIGADTPGPEDGAWLAIDGGLAHVCAVDADGAVRCWGDKTARTTVPAALGVGASALSAGAFHTCALDADGALSCWGDDGDWLAAEATGSWALVAAGNDLTCAWDGAALSCWGDAPADLSVFDGADLVSLSAGALGVCGVSQAGALTCALLEDATLPTESVTSVDLSAVDATTMDGSSAAYGCALTTAGLLSCFGGGAPAPLPE